MTEPTHQLRRDVAAELDILLTGVLMAQGFDQLAAARGVLRHALARAWGAGQHSGRLTAAADVEPATNPYDEMDIS